MTISARTRPLARAPIRRLLLPCLLAAASSPAPAGGGEHVVDDATVETPGKCHLESWVTRYDRSRGLLNLSPACTRRRWPRLEIGATLEHSWHGTSLTTFGPTLKYSLRPVGNGPGIALSSAMSLDLSTGRIQAASLIVPVTEQVSDRIAINFNGGWSYSRASRRPTAPFYGIQVQGQATSRLSLMAEAFGRGRGPVGNQIGVRWNLLGPDVDLDLIAGRYVDGSSPRAVSLGLTLRR